MFEFCVVSHLDHIQKVQYYGARIILGIDWFRHVLDMLNEQKWLNIKQRQDLHTEILTHKIQHGLAPQYLSNIRSNVSIVNGYVAISSIKGDLSVPNVKLIAKKRTFQFRATIIWNEIPHSLRNTPPLYIYYSGYIAQCFNES